MSEPGLFDGIDIVPGPETAGGRLPSLILWGPPGVGKTTIARILSGAGTGAAPSRGPDPAASADSRQRSRPRFVELSATSSGVRQVREVIEGAPSYAQRYRGADGAPGRTILFIDEIHRFNKSQQDALLQAVESGTITLIGATTENPSFEVVSPLLSRCRVVRLEGLAVEDIQALLSRALAAPAPRGLAGRNVEVSDEIVRRIAASSDGDARFALTTLELAVEIAAVSAAEPPLPGEAHDLAGSDEPGVVTEEMVQQAIQRPTLRHDKAGEEHFNLVSALQKSVRNSDPDAALYWLARMLEAGEDPLYVGRRLLRMASEEVGLADPQALGITIAGFETARRIGLPEGALALAQVAVYLSAASKSNRLYRGYAAAARTAREAGSLPVPMHLRNPTTELMRREGYGAGYRYAHDEQLGVSAMRCLPEELADSRFYEPSKSGAEAELDRRLSTAHRLRHGESEPVAAQRTPSAKSDSAD